jgi:hypothetical protein
MKQRTVAQIPAVTLDPVNFATPENADKNQPKRKKSEQCVSVRHSDH